MSRLPSDPQRPLLGFARVPTLGSVLAGCVLEAELGRGAMGVVYRARTPQGQSVAIKVMLTHGFSEDRRQRFRRELQLLSRLEHPQIVRVFGGEADGELPCMVLELVEGGDLEQVFADPSVELSDKLRHLEQVAGAMEFAHSKGVVHRDLKPANVFVPAGAGQTVKVGDFGLARELDRNTRMTASGQSLGTPAYMAPEQVVGDKDAGPAVDVYALGVMLFEALTGKLPFEAPTHMALLDAICKAKPPRPSLASDVAEAAHDRVVAKAMAKDPSQRYTAGELRQEITRLRLSRPRSSRLPGLIVGALLVAGGSLIAWGATRRAPLAPTPTESVPAPPAAAAPVAKPVSTPAPSASAASPKSRRARAHAAAYAEAEAAWGRLLSSTTADAAKRPAWVQLVEERAAAALEADPDSARAHLLLARVYDLRGEDARAIAQLDALAELVQGEKAEGESAYQALLLRACVVAARGESEAARALCDRANKRWTSRHEARALVIRARTLGSKSDSLPPVLGGTWHEDTTTPTLLVARGLELFRWSRALRTGGPEIVRLTREHFGDLADSPSRLWVEAKRILERAGKADPHDPTPHMTLFILHKAFGDLQKMHAARAEANRRSLAMHGLTGVWWKQAHTARRAVETKGDLPAKAVALRALRRGLVEQPGNLHLRAERAILDWVEALRAKDTDKMGKAIGGLSRAITLNPDHWETHFYRAHAARMQERPELSIKHFTRAAELNPGHAWVALGLTMTHLDAKHYRRAEQSALRALKLKPAWPVAQRLLERARAKR